MILGRSVLGDYYGSKYERHPQKDENIVREEIKTARSSKRFKITDDSILTFATAKWLLEDGEHSPESLVTIYKDFFRRHHSYYGSSFKRWANSDNAEPYNSFGNGSAMRVSPVGWYATSLDETLRLAKITAEVTHNHPEGIMGAQATAAVIYLQRVNYDKESICDYIAETFGYDLSRTYEQVKATYKFYSTCQKTVPEAIITWRDFAPDGENHDGKTPTYMDTIIKAIALGGDADTLGCITGSMCVFDFNNLVADNLLHDICPKEFIGIGLSFDSLVAQRKKLIDYDKEEI